MGARALFVVLAASLAGFAVLAVGYDHEPFATVDREVAQWVASDLPGWIAWLARPFSWLGGWIGLTVLGVAAAILLVRERAWLDLAFFVTAYLGSQLTVSLLKEWFDRPRPDVGSAVALPESAAFQAGTRRPAPRAWGRSLSSLRNGCRAAARVCGCGPASAPPGSRSGSPGSR